MKKFIFYLITACLFIAVIPNELKASPDSTHSRMEKSNERFETDRLIERLEEIKSLDKLALSHQEKRKLRKEVKSIEHRLKIISGGIYISVGALILILLLLIILL